MKKYLIGSLVALSIALVGALSANAAFMTNLTVGSTGPDVSALQSWLISKGFNIPAISSGVAAPGYFGQQTKAAVAAYQTSVGLPAYGFFGPLTQASVNAGGGVSSSGSCPAGYTCSPTSTTAVCPVGYTCTPTSGTPPPTGIVMDGTDGSITASLSSFAGNQTIKKGETKDMVAVKLQATAAPVSVTRFDVRFNNRPWLYFSTITLKDSTGNVIATKNLSGASDATEITVGSDYLVRFENLNTVVTPGTDKIFVVSGTVLATTDKLTNDVNIIVSVPNNSIRTVNGKGYTDSIGLGTVAVSGTSGRTMTLSSSGSTGNIQVKVSSASPGTRIVTTSTAGETDGVVLGKFDFRSQNRSSTINTLTFTLKDNGGNRAFSTMYKRVYLQVDSSTYQVDSVASSSVFSNLTINLDQDVWKTVTLLADVADQDDFVSGAMGSTTITVNATNIVGVDSNFTTVTASDANVVTSNDITFLPSGASVSNESVNTAQVTCNTGSVVELCRYSVQFNFTFNNLGNTDLYISKDPYLAVATTSNIATSSSQTLMATTTTFSSISDGTALTGDTTTVWRIPAGSSRAFIIYGVVDRRTRDWELTPIKGELKITKVYFGDDTTNIQESYVNFGLEGLTTGGAIVF